MKLSGIESSRRQDGFHREAGGNLLERRENRGLALALDYEPSLLRIAVEHRFTLVFGGHPSADGHELRAAGEVDDRARPEGQRLTDFSTGSVQRGRGLVDDDFEEFGRKIAVARSPAEFGDRVLEALGGLGEARVGASDLNHLGRA